MSGRFLPEAPARGPKSALARSQRTFQRGPAAMRAITRSCGVILFYMLSGQLPFLAQRVEDCDFLQYSYKISFLTASQTLPFTREKLSE